ncbi:hypothetical protein K504DRAFT_246466 [Pleomassaria siparia CBS 279.74]|uniref:Uncharacterized protein n=1 Tax=Pleomassaria siparia CBS 279.74 TaxID=1314801 RepID=A0A6G1KAG3_9PLEO|nr:hypothetical protein K504DRAFT_246466 [Pleomassaria siparia CBS 279.74]
MTDPLPVPCTVLAMSSALCMYLCTKPHAVPAVHKSYLIAISHLVRRITDTYLVMVMVMDGRMVAGHDTTTDGVKATFIIPFVGYVSNYPFCGLLALCIPSHQRSRPVGDMFWLPPCCRRQELSGLGALPVPLASFVKKCHPYTSPTLHLQPSIPPSTYLILLINLPA